MSPLGRERRSQEAWKRRRRESLPREEREEKPWRKGRGMKKKKPRPREERRELRRSERRKKKPRRRERRRKAARWRRERRKSSAARGREREEKYRRGGREREEGGERKAEETLTLGDSEKLGDEVSLGEKSFSEKNLRSEGEDNPPTPDANRDLHNDIRMLQLIRDGKLNIQEDKDELRSLLRLLEEMEALEWRFVLQKEESPPTVSLEEEVDSH